MNETHDDSLSKFKQNLKRPPRNLAEWVTFGFSSLVVVAISGLVVYAWATNRDRPPVITIKQSENIREEHGQFYVPFEISNMGGETAETVVVVATLQKNGKVEESGDLQINFLAQGEKEKGAFVFSQNPRDGKLMLRVSSYKAP